MFVSKKKYNELLEQKEELEAKLDAVTEHIQLADGTIFAIEEALYRQKGDSVIQLHIDEYYEEVKLLDTK
jgi:predicted nuclease with TOPRIM domain